MDYNPTVAQIKTQCYLSVGPLALDQALRQGIVDVAMEKDATTVDPSSFSLLVSTPSGLSPSQASSALNPHHSPQTPLTNQHFLFLQVSVAFSDAYDRIPRSDVSLEDTISEVDRIRLCSFSSAIVSSCAYLLFPLCRYGNREV